MATATEPDYLEYVRQRLQAMDASEIPRLAVDAGITQRAIYYLINGQQDARYSTVKKLRLALLASDKAKAKATRGHK